MWMWVVATGVMLLAVSVLLLKLVVDRWGPGRPEMALTVSRQYSRNRLSIHGRGGCGSHRVDGLSGSSCTILWG
jgi:hypothetical protein